MLKKLDCVLFHCARYNNVTPIITMGLWGLADILTKHGFPTKIVHTGIEAELNNNFQATQYIHDNLIIAGVSAHWFPMVPESLDILMEIKQVNPHIFTLLGGFTASFFARQIISEFHWVDGVIRGDSEIPLLKLIHAVKHKQSDLKHIPNLIWRDGEQVIENEFSYTSTEKDIIDIDFVNYPQYLHNFTKGNDYILHNHSGPGDFMPRSLYTPYFYLLTGKGCVNDCVMCGGGKEAQIIINNRRECMTLPDTKIMEIMCKAMEMNYRHFQLCSNPVPIKTQYFTLLKAIRDKGLDIDMTFDCWQLPSEEEVMELKKSVKNLVILISPDTISECVRKKTRNRFYFSNKDLFHIIDFMYKNEVYCFLFFSYFLPFTSEREVAATREIVWELNSKYPHYIEAYYIKISTEPGSPLYMNPDKFNIVLHTKSIGDYIEKAHTIKHQEDLLGHSINSIPKSIQKKLARGMEFDAAVKHIFKLMTKYFTRAFPSVGKSVAFLDHFYTAFYGYTLLEGKISKSRKIVYSEMLILLKEIAVARIKTVKDISPYLPDLIEYVLNRVLIQETEYKLIPGDSITSEEDIYSYAISLPEYVRIAEFSFDIFHIEKDLRKKRRFSVINQRSNYLMFYKHKNKEVRVNEINKILFRFLSLCKHHPQLSCSRIVKKLRLMYKGQRMEWENVNIKLMNSLMKMKKRCLFLLKK